MYLSIHVSNCNLICSAHTCIGIGMGVSHQLYWCVYYICVHAWVKLHS